MTAASDLDNFALLGTSTGIGERPPQSLIFPGWKVRLRLAALLRAQPLQDLCWIA